MQNLSTGIPQYDKMRISKAPNVGCHVKITGKEARDSSRGYLVCLYAAGCPQQVTPAFPFAKRLFLEGATVANPHKGNPPQARTRENGCTNFSEISYEETRDSYDRSAIAPGSRKCLLSHQSGLPAEQASPASACLPCYTPAAIQRTSTPRRERCHDNNRRS